MIELLLDRLWEGVSAGMWSDREALDSIADLNPETELGRVLTSVMNKVCQVNLLDPLLGFTRQCGIVRIWFSQHASREELEELVEEINSDYSASEDNIPPITARLIQTEAPEQCEEKKVFVVELRYQMEDAPIPTDMDLAGEVDVERDGGGKSEDDSGANFDEEGESEDEE